jgi:hypothetical protein
LTGSNSQNHRNSASFAFRLNVSEVGDLNLQPGRKLRSPALVILSLYLAPLGHGQDPAVSIARLPAQQTVVLPKSVPDPIEPFNRVMWAFNKAAEVSGRVTPHSAGAFLDYSHSMNKTKLFFNAGRAGIVLNALFLLTLAGCGGSVDVPNASVTVASPAVVVQEDYVYYPSYEIYYSSSLHQYAYLEGGVWVSQPAPRGVSVDVLLASPSVRMDFHDSPAQHHAAVVQKYPKNWKPSGPSQKSGPGDERAKK